MIDLLHLCYSQTSQPDPRCTAREGEIERGREREGGREGEGEEGGGRKVTDIVL